MSDAPSPWSAPATTTAAVSTSTSATSDQPLFPPTNTAKPLPPPPLPAKPLAFAPALPPPPPAMEEAGNFARLAARLSWMSPIVGGVFGMVGSLLAYEPVGQIIGAVGGLMLLVGIGLALLGLANIRRHGKHGILTNAMVGLSVNLALLLLGVWLTMSFVNAARRAPQAKAPAFNNGTLGAPMTVDLSAATVTTIAPANAAPAPPPPAPATPIAPAAPAAPAAPSAVSDERLPGWVGFTDRTDLRIIVLQYHDDAPGRRKLKELYEADSMMVTVVINNSVGGSHVTIDPASLEFHLNDYSTVKALPPKQILEMAKFDRDYYLKRYGGEWNVPPRAVRTDGLAFFPPGTDLTKARAVTMMLNGQRIVVPGQYCTAAEKAEFLEQLQVAREASRPMHVLHALLAIAHALASAAWFGSMFYSLTVMQPRANGFFATDSEFEEFVATIAQGARWNVLAAFAFVAITGAGLILVARPTPITTSWLTIVALKIALFAAAVAIFAYASWRLWPRRIFATPTELPAIQRRFRIVGFSLLTIAALSFALGILPHTW